MLKFRTRNLYLPVARLYYNNKTENVFDQTQCPLCNELCADEFHYILKCANFKNERKKYFGNIINGTNINVLTFQRLMDLSNGGIDKCKKITIYSHHTFFFEKLTCMLN